MRLTYDKEFGYWPMDNNQAWNISRIESHGRSLEELAENTSLVVEDHTGALVDSIDAGALSTREYDYLLSLYSEFLADCGASRSFYDVG